ncbi:MAG TPA: sulfurtransferase TusA family protein [Nitrososphaerales archaeon]|nr:sulfurtransferase TusA family protein [Nitrososphaerales archaeon]
MTTTDASLVLDTRGSLCPVPIMKTSQAIKQVNVGEVLEVLATDPGSKPDISAWTRMTGNELVDVSEEGGTPKVYRFRIRRLR